MGANTGGPRGADAAQADADAPTISGVVAGEGVSRSRDFDATEKFQTAAGSGDKGTPQGAGAKQEGRPGADAGNRPGAAAAAAGAAAAAAGAAAAGAAGAASLRKGGGEVPASEDQTIAMRVVNPADAPTTAMPVQRPQGTDRVVPPSGGRPMTPPPNTPRGPAGPRQAGHQGPAGPHGPGVEETQPSPPRAPIAPPKPASAPSPADIQPTRPAQQLAEGKRQVAPPEAPRPVAPPQRIEAPQEPAADKPARSKRWLLAAAGAAVLVIALIVTVVTLMTGGDNSPEGQVRTAIGAYADALGSGDLDDLRSSTCGQLHDFYQGITADQFKGVHQLSTERGSIPVVASVDAVRITGDTALAEATVYTSADPAKRTARTFDLQRTDGSWKVCDPAGTP
ncbi:MULTISPECIES: Rv0361 family membrane protein [unclassified Nocardia]|uniref:Rv0361 family membrane protein n=1 Tax=unclassified Nocardia TaxID=2637762 RepID=UPI0033B035DF